MSKGNFKFSEDAIANVIGFIIIGIALYVHSSCSIFHCRFSLQGRESAEFFVGFIALFVLAVIVRLVSAQFEFNRYLEWAFFALIVGLIVANTIGIPSWLVPAMQTEYYIKTGL